MRGQKVPAYATPAQLPPTCALCWTRHRLLPPMQRVLVPTGLAIELPGAHSVALVYARSGLFHQARPVHGQRRGRGGQRLPRRAEGAHGQSGREAYTIQPGERVAQLCMHRCTPLPLCLPKSWAIPSAARAALALPEKTLSIPQGKDKKNPLKETPRVRWNHEPDLSFRQPAQAGAPLIYHQFHRLRQRF